MYFFLFFFKPRNWCKIDIHWTACIWSIRSGFDMCIHPWSYHQDQGHVYFPLPLFFLMPLCYWPLTPLHLPSVTTVGQFSFSRTLNGIIVCVLFFFPCLLLSIMILRFAYVAEFTISLFISLLSSPLCATIFYPLTGWWTRRLLQV